MKNFLSLLIGLMTLAAIPAACFGQDGNDIATSIPIYFGQTINDTVDNATRPYQVYNIAAGKGQQITVTGTSTKGINYYLYPSTAHTVINNGSYVASGGGLGVSFNYQVSTAGVYYVAVVAPASGEAYKLQVTAQGTPVSVPNPAQAGCVTGQVDYITYSLQLVAAGLPDTASIGGTQLCASCTVKPPAYPLLVTKMETAMGMNVGVSACYDSVGNIFQLKLIHP
jgi:hypothetical protein